MIRNIFIDDRHLIGLNQIIESERRIAVTDLLAENSFQLLDFKDKDRNGHYHLHLSIKEYALILDIKSEQDQDLILHKVSLRDFRSLIKDYFMICESYYKAIKEMNPARVEAIDMSRRGLHNEGAELLCESLKNKVTMDENTARRLFTLICVLHIRQI